MSQKFDFLIHRCDDIAVELACSQLLDDPEFVAFLKTDLDVSLKAAQSAASNDRERYLAAALGQIAARLIKAEGEAVAIEADRFMGQIEDHIRYRA